MTQDMEKKRDMRIILSDVCRDRRRMMLEIEEEIEEAEARANAQSDVPIVEWIIGEVETETGTKLCLEPVYANDEEGEENA